MKATCFAFLTALFLISGCESETHQAINTLGSEVELSMTEYVEEGHRVLSLKFLTRKDFPCINYRIKHSVSQDDQRINIVLDEVEKADVCLDAIGPASAFVELGQLNNQEYKLTVQLGKSIVKSGTLTVSKDAYQLQMHDYDGVLLLNPELLRVPAQTVWGLLKYQRSDKNKEIYKFFEESMELAGASDKKFAEGDYGYFKVGADGKILRTVGDPKTLAEQPFLYDFRGDEDDLKAVLKQLNSKFDDLQLRLHNAKGQEFRNWDLN